MDARALIKTVAETYRGLQTLAVNLEITEDSENESGSIHRVQRAKAFFAAPHKVRMESGGRRGSITVMDGIDLHRYHPSPKRYSKHPAPPAHFLPGVFRPEAALLSDHPFLFANIAERVADVAIVRAEPLDGESAPCTVLRVTYEAPDPPRLYATSPVSFWIDSRTNLVAKLEADVTVLHPAHDEAHTSKWSLRFQDFAVNEHVFAA